VATFPWPSALAFLVVGILAGEFANMWRRRTQRLVTSLEYHRLRLEEFTRTYHVLKEAFDDLNRQNLTDPHNLREALITFRQQLSKSNQHQDPFLGQADAILGLFADFSQIYAAALYPVADDGTLASQPVARLGTRALPSSDDPLLAAALNRRLLTSVGADLRGRESETQLLAAIPLVDVSQRVWGVIAIQDMLFSSFQRTVLQRMAVLGGHVGDQLAFRRPASDEDNFRRRVERCRSDARQFGLSSSALRVTEADSVRIAGLLDAVLEQRRGLDAAYCLRGDGSKSGSSLLLLLPLTDEAGLLGYRERLSRMVDEFSGPVAVDGKSAVHVEDFVLREDEDFQKLLRHLDEMAGGGQGRAP
jgi:hypothetical protein